MRYFFKIVSIVSILCLLGCSPKERGEHEIWVGTIVGPETDLMITAQAVAQQKHQLTLKIVTFEDYATPNMALMEGEIDANMFQHQPYLDAMAHYKTLHLTAIGKTFIYPMGLYSKTHKNLSELPDGSTVGIPIDASNGARALLLLEKAGLITLKNHDTLSLTQRDIVYNPKKLAIVSLYAEQIPQSLPDLGLAAINTNYALLANLIPSRDALVLEDKNSPYANIVVVRTAEKDALKYHQLMEALHSPEVQEKAKTLFHSQAIAAW